MSCFHQSPIALWAAAAANSGAELIKPKQAEQVTNLMEKLSLPALLSLIAMVFIGTLVMSKFARRLQVPAVLGVLLLGAAINPEEQFFNNTGVENLHIVSLTMLLFYAGLTTRIKNIRQFLGYGLMLAVGGVAVSSLVFGLIIFAVYALFSGTSNEVSILPLGICMLIAASLGSTDAGATLSVLSSVQRYVPERVRNLLEFESSVNDPAAILFLMLVTGIFYGSGHSAAIIGQGVVGGVAGEFQTFFKSIGSGIMVGLILTYISQHIVRHYVISRDQILIVGISIAIASYGMASLLKGSGFISAYVTGVFLASNIYDNPLITEELLENSLESFNTFTEMLVFLMFGIIIDPLNILNVLPEGFVCALSLMFIVRPVSVFLFKRFAPFNNRETILICWCGLRGAVPLALTYAVIHTIENIPSVSSPQIEMYTQQVEGLIFLTVLLNLALQGLSLPWLSRKLGLTGQIDEAVEAS